MAEPEPITESLVGVVGETALAAAAERVDAQKWGGGGGIPWLGEYERMAMAVARAVILPRGIRDAGDPRTPEGRASIAATVLAVALAGREYGLGFMSATRLIHVIDGKTSPAAELMVQRARELGHVIVPIQRTPRACRVTCKTCELPVEEQAEWALTEADRFTDDAVIASQIVQATKNGRLPLTEKENWRAFAFEMLWWRAAVQLIRRHCGQATSGFYAVEEIADGPLDEGDR